MAFAAVGSLGSTTDKTSGTATLQLTVAATAEVGNLVAVFAAFDNEGTTGETSQLSLASSPSNTWTKLKEYTQGASGNSDGITVAMWVSRITTQLTSGSSTITVTSTSNRTAKAMAAYEFTVGGAVAFGGVSGTDYQVDGGASGNDPAAMSLSGLASRQYLLLHVNGEERGATRTADADYTEIFDAVETSGGSAASNVSLFAAYRIATLTGDTVDAASATDGEYAQIVAAIYESANAYTLNVEPGAYAVTGAQAGVLEAAALNVAAGSYAVTGAEASFSIGFQIDLQPGTYAVTGNDTGLIEARLLNAAAGSYAMTGAAAGLELEVTGRASPVHVTKLEAQGSSSNASSYTTQRMSPMPNRPIIVVVRNRRTDTADPTTPVLSGTQCGLTWTQVGTQVFPSSGATRQRLTVFKANGSGAVSGTLQFTFGGTTQHGCQWSIVELDYADDTTEALVQATFATGNSTQASVTLSSFGDTDNATLGFFLKDNTESWSAGSGFISISEQSFASGRMLAQWRRDNDTSVDSSTWTTAANWIALGIEVKAAAGSAPATQLLTPGLADLLGTPSGSAIYVAAAGNDTTGDGSTGNPYATLNKALTVVGESGIIRLKYQGGTAHAPLSGERESVQVQGKSASEPIMIETDPADSPDYTTGANLAKFTGELQVGDSSNRAYSNLILQNLELTKLSSLDTSGAGANCVRVGNFRNLEIRQCRIHDSNASAIHVTCGLGRCENILIHHNRIHNAGSFGASHNANYNHDHGVYWGGQYTLGGVKGGAVWNNLIYRCYYGRCFILYADGSNTFPASRSAVFAHNTCYDVGFNDAASDNGWIIAVGDVGSSAEGTIDAVIANNLLVNNQAAADSREAALWVGNGDGNVLSNNLVYQIQNATKFDAAGASGGHWTLVDNIEEQDPLFDDPANGDFDIDAGSPAIGAALAAFVPDDDFYGNTRTGDDIGAIAAAVVVYELNVEPGSYTLTGSLAGALAARLVDAAAGSYTVTGAASGTAAHRVVNAEAGTYSIAGAPAGVTAARMIHAAAGSYALTGFEAELVFTPLAGQFELALDAGVYTLTGAQAQIPAARLFNAGPGIYLITGADAGAVAARILSLAPGSYAITGVQAGLLANRVVNAAAGVYTITGAQADLDFSGAVDYVPVMFGRPSPTGGIMRGTPAAATFGPPSPTKG